MDVLEKLLFNLRTIANIPKGKKIRTDQEFINLEEEGLLQPVWRTISHNSRERAVKVVQTTVETVIFLTELMLESKYLYMEIDATVTVTEDCDVVFGNIQPEKTDREKRLMKIKEIAFLLDDSRIGIENLCETYLEDTNVVAALKPLMSKIDFHIAKTGKILMEMGEVLKKTFQTKF